MLFDIETDVLQNSVKSSVLVNCFTPTALLKINSMSSILSEELFRRKPQRLMATFNISKELVVTLKYFYEKSISVVSRNHVEMFAF